MQYIVTFTSMVIEADSEEEAIDRAGDFKGGGHWEAHLLPHPHFEVIPTMSGTLEDDERD